MIQPSLPEHALILVGPSDRRRDAAFAGLGRVRMLGWQHTGDSRTAHV